MRQQWESDPDDYWYEYEDEDDDDEELECIRGWCREAAGYWPTLREIYLHWSWAERFVRTHHAETAETRAFPADPQAWERLVRRLAKLAKFKACDKALASLAALPGTNTLCSRLHNHIAFQKVCDAFDRKLPFAALQSLADVCTDVEPMERIGIAVRLWLRAEGNAQRRRCGAAMADLGHPWLAAVHCYQLSDEEITVSKLPAPLKQALQKKPVAVVDDFLFLAGYTHRNRINWQDDTLMKPLLAALADPGVPPQTVLDALYHLMLGSWHEMGEAVITEFCGEVVAITARLLDTGEHPSSVAVGALAYRVLLYEATGYVRDDSDDSIAARLLRAARQLAADSQSRGIVREIGDKTGLVRQSAVIADDTDEALALWRQQCGIRCEQDFWEHFYSEREPVPPGKNRFGGEVASQIERIARALGMPHGSDEDEDWDDFDDFDAEDGVGTPVTRTPWPAARVNISSRDRIDLNKCYPTSEMEFETLIDKISLMDGATAEALLIRKIEESNLSDKAKARLFERLARTIEGGGVLF